MRILGISEYLKVGSEVSQTQLFHVKTARRRLDYSVPTNHVSLSAFPGGGAWAIGT